MEKYNREEFEEVIVDIGRVTKVVKGGRRFRFTALVIVGNRKGLVGVGYGKAKEVPDAIRKAVDDAFKNIVEVKTKGSTIAHDVEVKYNASRILLKPASEGTGVIAGGSTRPIVELAGIKDILTKSLGSNTKVNVAKATLEALKCQRTCYLYLSRLVKFGHYPLLPNPQGRQILVLVLLPKFRPVR